ncbi:MAG: hypothetical protein UY21_C0030G0003 [Microgenomates group bacterium GW2011_GWA1_48_10]|uniref:AI-2E family transporter n=1 Tax=Candidatus Gottesmanbacteria bacterium RIFCSPHIGHO2_01_FULL_47_48 TaxID=1798381 RepID=A0A1F6A1F4_9BACT|nr:MAG: hypothetical protein UY21_C0030G0003 [Microgenomates group bacterium GW2011_GWA1_48_10]OGG18434.1 MAG: hypothetical protein A2721_01450 [Candidatus Gottesmanbacteria bacterium RIFCSPHIGHO2_01_FULL_47_48]
MFKSLSKFPEWRILAYLGIITLSWHLFTIFGSFLSLFADIFLIILLAWILAFILEPAVTYLSKKGLNRTTSAVVVYLSLAAIATTLLILIVPTTVVQLSQLSTTLPVLIPSNSIWSTRVETFLTTTLTSSITFASQIASLATILLLVFILSFYFLLSRQEISRLILSLIPEDYKEEYLFLEHVINTTFASFIRIQVFLGLILGLLTFLTLWVLRIDFALSSGVASAFLATIPVAGAILFLFPPLLAVLAISPQKLLITAAILVLAAQIVYNFLAPRLLGKALQIHPVVVLLSFLIGYKLAGAWGAIFAVPLASTLAVVARDVFKYWQEEADK